MNCELGNHIRPEGWHNWGKKDNEQTARYLEYNNTGDGSDKSNRVAWSKQLSKKEAQKITPEVVFNQETKWIVPLVAPWTQQIELSCKPKAIN